MILYEYEGKSLLAEAGIAVPKSQLLVNTSEPVVITTPCVLKAQTLSGKRAKSGGIIKISSEEEISPALNRLLNKSISGEIVETVLIEELVEYFKTYYVSFSYDTDVRQLVITWSDNGGTDIEDRKTERVNIDILNPIVPDNLPLPQALLAKLLQIFLTEDCLLLEVNPLVETKQGYVALDAKVKFDDCAFGRHKTRQFSPRATSDHQSTARELAAKKIDSDDHRGTAGSAYLDLDGDIAVLASGGGASLVAMDALISAGGKPANYTEYSGNPPREKVERLTEVVLSKPGLCGLWIVGAVANFTDIYETLTGIVEGLRRAQETLGLKFDFPIVIRRGGPHDQEAFAMLKTVKDFDLHIYGSEVSIAESAKTMTKLAGDYRPH